MEFYIQVFPQAEVSLNGQDAQTHQVWRLEGRKAELVGFEPTPLNMHKADDGEEIIQTLRKRFSGNEFHKLALGPGEFYPRMARPFDIDPAASPGSNPDDSDIAKHARAISTGQLHSLIEQLDRICRVIHPRGENLKAYGHEIRNLLIIACTEVEAQWKAILDANHYTKKDTTRDDYKKLIAPLKLRQYEVTLNYYPWLEPIRPFENWELGNPPGKLVWYDAYNCAKHDRETKFSEAKLLFALQAIAGCFVMLCAQYGWGFALQGTEALQAFFRLAGTPKWSPADIYVPGSSLKAVDYPLKKRRAKDGPRRSGVNNPRRA